MFAQNMVRSLTFRIVSDLLQISGSLGALSISFMSQGMTDQVLGNLELSSFFCPSYSNECCNNLLLQGDFFDLVVSSSSTAARVSLAQDSLPTLLEPRGLDSNVCDVSVQSGSCDAQVKPVVPCLVLLLSNSGISTLPYYTYHLISNYVV